MHDGEKERENRKSAVVKGGNAMHRLNDRFVLSVAISSFVPSFLSINSLDGSPNHPNYLRSRSTSGSNVGTVMGEDKRTIRVDRKEHLANAREIITGLAFSQIKGRELAGGLEPLSCGSRP